MPVRNLELYTFLDGTERRVAKLDEVGNPYSGEAVGSVGRADEALVAEVTGRARQVFLTSHWPVWQQAEVLDRAARTLDAERSAFAELIASEAGKPVEQSGRRSTGRSQRCGSRLPQPGLWAATRFPSRARRPTLRVAQRRNRARQRFRVRLQAGRFDEALGASR